MEPGTFSSQNIKYEPADLCVSTGCVFDSSSVSRIQEEFVLLAVLIVNEDSAVPGNTVVICKWHTKVVFIPLIHVDFTIPAGLMVRGTNERENISTIRSRFREDSDLSHSESGHVQLTSLMNMPTTSSAQNAMSFMSGMKNC
ncbi:unnamed protein product [Protopolystoma xenopodis]|uniref:Uncharacterized protein n=1 Tax=Protopolystoma xenopodis TaxID=117903 RepID=A0A3S5FEJ0_9PLAT|nr:unnamed protein product [Protopolystoma xenopodis]